jgi:hypothetical protein
MGRIFAEELADTNLTLEQKVGIHLRSNCYPPVPSVMIEPCVKAIEIAERSLYDEDVDVNEQVELPEGVLYRNSTTAPAIALVENYRLESFVTWEEE